MGKGEDSFMVQIYPCVIHPKKPNNNGYVYVRKIGAHVLALERRLGRKLLPGMWALHTCDVKNCVQEWHLYEGTRLDNAKDAVERGRYKTGDQHYSRLTPEKRPWGDRNGAHTHPEKVLRGEANGKASLDDNKVLFIRELRKYGIWNISAIARILEVGRGTVRRVITREAWGHVH